MDFSWTEEQIEFKGAAIKFAQKELNDDLIGRDRESTFLRQNWQKAADFGDPWIFFKFVIIW